ncbi:MAG: TIGR03016 family PEP-CTERM system-associated outer membrane protein [Rhodocyclaceae bacterium]|nr:TIGR03016 family PEP-CTERM system-associated outer membrane protein [Rhodocyclaceae bacterium]
MNRLISPSLLLLSALGLLAPGFARAQAEASAETGPVATQKPSWLITPSVSVGATMTDNARPGQGEKKGDLITNLAPAIRIDGKGGRVSGNLHFSWQQNIYANESAFNNDQKSLNATGKAELVEQWLFLDANANIAQQATSVFGTQSVGNELINNNRGQTTSYQWSPYIQGRFVGSADYELRYRNMQTSADAGVYATGSGVDTQAWSGRLSGATPLALLGWSLSAEDQRTKFAVRDTKSSRVLGTLEYRFDPQLKFNVSAGREADNYSSLDLQNRTTSGYGADWAPTERTKLTVKKDKRGFGDGHTIDFSHATALTAWKLLDSRSVVVPGQQQVASQLSPYYDLFNARVALFPPSERAAQASQLLQDFQAQGISSAQIFGNIQSTQPFIQRMQQASVSLIGANNTVTFSAQRSSNQRLGTGTGLIDQDFLNTANIRQSGLSGSWAHKLTPYSSLTLNALTSRSQGDLATQDSRLRSLSLLYTTRLGARTTAAVGLRQNSFENSGAGFGSSYDEHAITGSLSASF